MPDEEGTESTSMDVLVKAISDFANSEADRPVLVDVAVLVWEQVSYTDDGQTSRRMKYCIPTHNFSVSSALGLVEAGNAFIRRDLGLNAQDD